MTAKSTVRSDLHWQALSHNCVASGSTGLSFLYSNHVYYRGTGNSDLKEVSATSN